MLRTGLLLASLFIGVHCQAETEVDVMTGNDVIAACNIAPADKTFCDMIFLAIVKKATEEKAVYSRLLICIPETVTWWQMIQILRVEMANNPQSLHLPIGDIALSALYKAFPCKK